MTTLEDRLREYYRDEVAGLEAGKMLPAVLAAGARARRRARALWFGALAGPAVILVSVFAGLSLRAHMLPAPGPSASVHQGSTAPTPATSTPAASPGPAQSCSGQGGLTVCPGTVAVGDTVTMTAQATCGGGASGQPAFTVYTPIGTIGSVPATPTSTGFTASLRIPSSYPGSQQSGTAGLVLPVAPGSLYSVSTAGACQVPLTVAPTPSGMAGMFADTWHFHVTYLSIASDGHGALTWRDPSLCGASPGCSGDTGATFVLSQVTGMTARAVIQASNDQAQMPVGTSLTLTLEPHDTITVSGVSPGSAYHNTPLCGTQAASLSAGQQQAEGISCGA